MKKVTASFLVLLTLMLTGALAVAQQREYLDKSLPWDISVAPYLGQRYKAVVPDTLDLVDHANDAINFLTRAVAPEWDYEQYFVAKVDTNPPVFEMGHGGLLNINAKWLEALPGLRVMTGSDYNIEVDGKLIGSLVHVTGKDGLCYQPVDARPWGFFEEFTRKIGKPYADIFGEGRQLLAYAVWYQHDKNSLWKELAQRKIRRLSEITLKKADTLYFRLSRGYTPWDEDPTKGPVVPIGDHEIYDPKKGMTGTPATYIVGFIPQAGANWYRLTGYEPAIQLGGGLARYLHIYGEMLEEDTGRFLANHYTHVSHSLLSNLAYALTVQDREMTKWVKRGFDHILDQVDPDGTGIIVTDPTDTCFMADLINLGIMLSQADEGNYWERVDGWVRNTFVNLQIQAPEVQAITALPVVWKTNLETRFRQFDDGADRSRGGFLHSLTPYGRDRTIGCCNGNAARSIYYIWRSIVESDGEKLKVNLLMNRASPWADINSYLPYAGKVEVMVKESKEVSIRVPEWTNWNQVSCTVDGENRDFGWSNGYVTLGRVRKGQKVLVEFPMRFRKIPTTLKWTGSFVPGGGERTESKDCQVELKGNTIINITPDVELLIAKRHERYGSGKTPQRTVTRFVSKEQFVW